MSKPMKTGVVIATQFVDKSNNYNKKAIKTFADYINYCDRDNAIRNKYFAKFNLANSYGGYNDYMGNPEKSTGLFTKDSDALSQEQKKALKDVFQTAYDNDSIMWQTVVSFDNRFLSGLDIYDPLTGYLDEKILHDAVRSMMNQVFKNENMEDTAAWSASIHYNTDNIHIHIAYTEPISTRERKTVDGKDRPRGRLSEKTFTTMKSKMVNYLLENDYTYVDELVRQKLVGSVKENGLHNNSDLAVAWQKIYENLPSDKRLWHYNMNGLKDIRPYIDELTTTFLNTEKSEEFEAFKNAVLHQQATFKMAYGENSKYENYARTKMDDLYTRMGNAILSEMRLYSRLNPSNSFACQNRKSSAMGLNISLARLKNSLHKEFAEQDAQNQKEYEQLQNAIAYQAGNLTIT